MNHPVPPTVECPFCGGLAWRYVADELPDDETSVLIALDHEDTDEPLIGYHADGQWFWSLQPGAPDEPVRIPVYAWAHLPVNPPRK